MTHDDSNNVEFSNKMVSIFLLNVNYDLEIPCKQRNCLYHNKDLYSLISFYNKEIGKF